MKLTTESITTELKPGDRLPNLGASRLPVYLYPRPRCPECGGTRLNKYRSLADQGDGSALWWVKCADDDCAAKFKVLLE